MNLSGKTVVLTGATTGIGRAAALALAGQPARLIIHGPQSPKEVSGLTHSLQAVTPPGAELAYLRSDNQVARKPGIHEKLATRYGDVEDLFKPDPYSPLLALVLLGCSQ